MIFKNHVKGNTSCILFIPFRIQRLQFATKPRNYWKSKENVQNFLKSLGQKYNLRTFEDWNSISNKNICEHGGASLLNRYTLYNLKCTAFPEGMSFFDKPSQSKPTGYWDNKENVIQFLIELKQKYNLKTFEDWNLITHRHIKSIFGGNSLLKKYSMYDLKCFGFPDGKLLFNPAQKPAGYWNNEENIIKFLHSIKQKYNLESIDDWNSITQKQIGINGGRSLLQKYSMYDLKCFGFPEGKSFFDKPNQSKPARYWEKEENLQNFFSNLKEKYNLQTLEDWNSITNSHIISLGGRTLLQKFSMNEIKSLGFPDGKLFFKDQILYKPITYWDDKQNIDQFLDKLKRKYNLNTLEDWISLTKKQIQDNDGSNSLLNKFSVYEIKSFGFPEGKLFFNKKLQTTKGFWNDENNRSQFLEALKLKFNLKTPQDWQRLSREQIKGVGGAWLFSKKEYLKNTKISFEVYSENSDSVKYETFSLNELLHPNQLNVKQVFKRSSQRWLFLQVQKLFPHEEIVEDYFHSELSRKTGSTVQFDVFLIKKNIAIEYHGKQHYEDIPAGFATLEQYNNRDNEKLKLCKEYGIEIIVIPYWWDNKIDSLREALKKYLLPNHH